MEGPKRTVVEPEQRLVVLSTRLGDARGHLRRIVTEHLGDDAGVPLHQCEPLEQRRIAFPDTSLARCDERPAAVHLPVHMGRAVLDADALGNEDDAIVDQFERLDDVLGRVEHVIGVGRG